MPDSLGDGAVEIVVEFQRLLVPEDLRFIVEPLVQKGGQLLLESRDPAVMVVGLGIAEEDVVTAAGNGGFRGVCHVEFPESAGGKTRVRMVIAKRLLVAQFDELFIEDLGSGAILGAVADE